MMSDIINYLILWIMILLLNIIFKTPEENNLLHLVRYFSFPLLFPDLIFQVSLHYFLSARRNLLQKSF